MEDELFEVFIYDTNLELDETDDPTDAIVYFYPKDISVTYQLSLCGNMITLMKRLKSFLGSAPELIKWEGKKFTIVEIGKYAVFLGVDGHCVSDIAASALCKFLVDNILFYFSSVQDFATHNKELNTNSLIRCILERRWTDQEFNALPFKKMTELLQYTKLKLNKLMEFCCLHSGILSSCVMFREWILSSQMGSVVTGMMLNAFTINREIGIVQISEDFSGRFIPVYVSEKMYKRIVEKEKHRRYAADWEPCSTLSEPFPSQHDPRVQTHQDQSQHQDLGKHSDSETECPVQQRSQDIQQRETELTHDNELSLFICSDGNLSLIFLMEKYVERGSEERVKNIVGKCLRDLETISSEVVMCKESTEDTQHLRNYQFLQYTGGTCRLQENSASLKTGVIKLQDRFHRYNYLDDITVQSPHSIFYGKRAFSKTTYLSAGVNDNSEAYTGMPPCSNDPALNFGKTISEAVLKNNGIKIL